jgi:hypothetical protein
MAPPPLASIASQFFEDVRGAFTHSSEWWRNMYRLLDEVCVRSSTAEIGDFSSLISHVPLQQPPPGQTRHSAALNFCFHVLPLHYENPITAATACVIVAVQFRFNNIVTLYNFPNVFFLSLQVSHCSTQLSAV